MKIIAFILIVGLFIMFPAHMIALLLGVWFFCALIG
jgi:hypothetical protein